MGVIERRRKSRRMSIMVMLVALVLGLWLGLSSLAPAASAVAVDETVKSTQAPFRYGIFNQEGDARNYALNECRKAGFPRAFILGSSSVQGYGAVVGSYNNRTGTWIFGCAFGQRTQRDAEVAAATICKNRGGGNGPYAVVQSWKDSR